VQKHKGVISLIERKELSLYEAVKYQMEIRGWSVWNGSGEEARNYPGLCLEKQ